MHSPACKLHAVHTRIRKGLPILEPPSPKFVFKTTLGGAAVSAEPQKSTQKTKSASLDNSHRCMQLFTSSACTPVPQQHARGAALETDWRTGRGFSCELAHRTAAPTSLSLSGQSQGHGGADNSTQIRIGIERGEAWWGKPNQTVQQQQQ